MNEYIVRNFVLRVKKIFYGKLLTYIHANEITNFKSMQGRRGVKKFNHTRTTPEPPSGSCKKTLSSKTNFNLI